MFQGVSIKPRLKVKLLGPDGELDGYYMVIGNATPVILCKGDSDRIYARAEEGVMVRCDSLQSAIAAMVPPKGNS